MHFSTFQKDDAFVKNTNRIAIPEEADLNNYTTIGCYACQANVTVATLVNCPTTKAFCMDVRLGTGVSNIYDLVDGAWMCLTQELYTYDEPTIRICRTITQGTDNSIAYGNWYKVVISDASGNTTIAGKITAGSAQINGAANITGAATINGATTIGGTLKIKDILQMVDEDGYTFQVMRAYSSGTSYGCELCVGGSGNTFVGGGESTTALRNALGQSSSEQLYLTSDNNVYVYTNCNTIANKVKAATFNTSGNLLIKGTVTQNSADLAEIYRADCSLEIGDVVAISREDGYDVTVACMDQHEEYEFDDIIGVVSEKPALLMNTPDIDYHTPEDLPEDQYAVARVGIVRAKVSGSCKKGERLFLDDDGILCNTKKYKEQKRICFANETKQNEDLDLIEVIL